MSRYIDITGQKYGRLTVISRNGHTPHGHTAWDCVCDCGNKVAALAKCALTTGNTSSCGCLRHELVVKKNYRHGGSKTPLYQIWLGMQARCNMPNSSHYRYYGGRGIKIIWESFQEFEKDMGEEYYRRKGGKRSVSIERIDNDGHYSKENCRWATDKEQANNHRRNHFLEHKGERLTLAQWAERLGIESSRIRQRLNLGYTVEQALFTPKYKQRI